MQNSILNIEDDKSVKHAFTCQGTQNLVEEEHKPSLFSFDNGYFVKKNFKNVMPHYLLCILKGKDRLEIPYIFTC